MRRTLLKIAVPAIVFLLFTWLWVVDFSALSVSLAKAVMGCAVLYIVLKYGHDELDHIQLWREQPLYGALVTLGYALVIAAALVGS